MRAVVFSAFAILGTAASAIPAHADVIVRDHRDPVVRVRVAPPVVRTEVRVVAPSHRHVWVPGYWNWQGGRHVWVGGRWSLPPVEGQTWVEPRWVNEGGEWIFYGGYWSEAPRYAPPPGTVVVPASTPRPVVREEPWVVDREPPPPQQEERPEPPSPRHVWITGYWGWSGHEHVWISGHWEAERPGWYWADGHWERHGHHYRWHPGHWRHR